MDFCSLDGRNILITGASSGIGAAVAKVASGRGAKCILNGRNESRLNVTLKTLQGQGHCLLPMDIAQTGRAELVDEAVKLCGPISGFVHCAGIEKTLPFRSTDLSELHEVMSINFDAYWKITQEILKRHNHSSQVSFVAISSVSALYGASGNTAYAASKGALISLTKSLAAEYCSKGIRFNCICPGYVDTPMLSHLRSLYGTEERFKKAIVDKHPLGIGTVEDIANMAVFLLSDSSRWITGSVMSVDGGYGVR